MAILLVSVIDLAHLYKLLLLVNLWTLLEMTLMMKLYKPNKQSAIIHQFTIWLQFLYDESCYHYHWASWITSFLIFWNRRWCPTKFKREAFVHIFLSNQLDYTKASFYLRQFAYCLLCWLFGIRQKRMVWWIHSIRHRINHNWRRIGR